jgi:hypothetical protein
MVALAGCESEIVAGILAPRDLTPPSVASWNSEGSREFVVEFDEDVSATPSGFAVVPAMGTLTVQAEGKDLKITSEAAAVPGASYSLEGTVLDACGNSTSFVLPFWGYNPRLPVVLINEALTQGSSTHPDAVELAILSTGNLAGLTFRVGSAGYSVLRYILPSCEAAAGEFVVLHLKPQGIAVEVDELADTGASGGLDASNGGRDFWYRGGDGALSGENGAVSLYGSPTGMLVDALLYSSRTSASDTKYAGFGSQALLDQATDIVAAGGWKTAGGAVSPEDAAASGCTTATRTLCRSSASADTDSSADWHVVPTRGSSLGAANSDEVYSP